MDVDGNSLGLALGPPTQGQSGVSTQSDETTIVPASTFSGHVNSASQSTSDHAARFPPSPASPVPPLPTGNLLDAGPVANPLAGKPKSKAKTGTVLKDSGHQTARFVLVLPCRLYEFNHHPGIFVP
jgi:hypothetical protein